MLSNDHLYTVLTMLAPNCVFSFWVDDGRELINPQSYCTCYKMDGWCIAWNNSNELPCPSWEQIEAVGEDVVNDYRASLRKADRDSRYVNDLIYRYAYNQFKENGNPNATFSDFMDYLESIQV